MYTGSLPLITICWGQETAFYLHAPSLWASNSHVPGPCWKQSIDYVDLQSDAVGGGGLLFLMNTNCDVNKCDLVRSFWKKGQERLLQRAAGKGAKW